MMRHCDRALALADGVLLEGARHAH
jgi:putative ABC transport system ATP-binding protein